VTQPPAFRSTTPWSVWLVAARPATLPAAIVPVIVGTAAAGGGVPRPLSFVAALCSALLIQVGTNFANDLFDFRRGADTVARLGPRRVTQSGLVSPRQVANATGVAFGLAALFGLYLVATSGWVVVVIGVLSILCGIAYTGGPWPLGYHGLGDIFVFVFFGLVAVIGSAYVQIGVITPLAVASAVPVGLLVTAILIVNNLRDIDTDRAAGKETLAVRLGRRFTQTEYATFLVVPYAVPVVLRLVGLVGPWFWLPVISLPLALRLVRLVTRTSDAVVLNRVLKQTGQLHLVFGLLFAVSLIVG
jgi:1,4-dihydroxy-2-naphthoate polyprenyltransferase